MNDLVFFVLAFLFSALIAFGLSFIVKGVAIKFGIVNNARENRHSSRPVPLLGGVAIFVAFWASVLLMIYLSHIGMMPTKFLGANNEISGVRFFGVFVGTAIIFVVGLIDDIKKIHFSVRIAAQVVATFIMVYFGFVINFVYMHSFLTLCLTFAWIILIINAFNLLDNMDGLSSGTGLISALIFLTIAYLQQSWLFALIIAFFAGSIAGFLPWNLPKAKIFMGDSGSTLIGYMLAHITLSIPFHSYGENLGVTVLIPILVFAVPLYDTLSVVLIRLKRRQPIYVGDANHFSHRLVVLGMSERRAVFMNYVLAWATGLTALLLLQVNRFGALIIFIIFLCIMMIIALLERSAIVKMRLQGKVT